MKSIWINLSENQQDWVYTIIGLLIILSEIGWIIIVRDSGLNYMFVFIGLIVGFFLAKGKLKQCVFTPKGEKN